MTAEVLGFCRGVITRWQLLAAGASGARTLALQTTFFMSLLGSHAARDDARHLQYIFAPDDGSLCTKNATPKQTNQSPVMAYMNAGSEPGIGIVMTMMMLPT